MQWPGRGRAALLLTVGALFVSAQVQIWVLGAQGLGGGRLLHALLVAGIAAPLLIARRHQLFALLAILASASVHYWLGGSLGQPWFAILLAVYALSAHARQRSSAIGMSAVAISILSIDLPRLQQNEPLDEVLPAWFIIAGTWGLGRWIRDGRRDHENLLVRTEAVERDRDKATRAAVAYERSQIARELHDLVAHSLAVVVLQAQAAERVLTTDPQGTRRALGSIESVGRQGLGELRRLLQVLVDGEESADLGPRPSLEHLDLLLQRVREAGLPVEVAIDGEPRPLPPGLDLSAYRIIQEALTNTLKHAGFARAAVALTYRSDALEVQVTDDGPRDQPTETQRIGHGLIGMRERVELYGGTLDTGRQPAGGFRVLARLPLGGASS